jgi:cytochrome c-type biogenesis protein CcmH
VTILFGILAVVLLLAAVWVSGLFNRTVPLDIAPALRELLLAKEQGTITEEEFSLRQAALHSVVLNAVPPAVDKMALLRALPIALAALGLLGYALTATQSADSPKAGSSPSVLGMGEKLGKGAPVMPGGEPAGEAAKGGDLNNLVKGLADKMANDPNNADGWLLLARTYGELRQSDKAAAAYEHVSALTKLDAQSLADWADAHVMARDRQWDDKGRDIVKQALKADPKNAKALALAGSEAFDRKQYKVAIDFWKRLKAVESPDSMNAKLADSNIAEATALMSGKKLEPVAAPAAAAPLGAAGAIAGTLSLEGAVKGKAAPTDTVFLVVKAADGSNPPLAAKRYQVSELPVKFQLDDSSAMIPGRAISKFPEVLVSARLSKSGEATAQPGDVMSKVVRTKPGVTDIQLEIISGK